MVSSEVLRRNRLPQTASLQRNEEATAATRYGVHIRGGKSWQKNLVECEEKSETEHPQPGRNGTWRPQGIL